MKFRTILFGLLMFALGGFFFANRSAAAQTTTQTANCQPATVIAAANALKSTGDNKQDETHLLDLAAQIDASNVACFGLKFTGSGKQVIAPFTLPAGVYRVTLLTATDLTAKPTVISGTCGGPYFYGNAEYWFAVSDFAQDGVETTVRSEGCQLILEINQTFSSAWSIDFNPLQGAAPPAVAR